MNMRPLIIVLIGVLLLAFLAFQAGGQTVTLRGDPAIAPLGQPIDIVLTNNLSVPIVSASLFGYIEDSGGNAVYLPPPPPPALWYLRPGRSHRWPWPQIDQNLKQVAPGQYAAVVRYSLENSTKFTTLRGRFTIDGTQITPVGSAGRGTRLDLHLNAPGAAAKPYQVGLSLGRRPAIRLPGMRLLRLTPDPLLVMSVQGGPLFGGFIGVLDLQGRATAAVTIPNDPGLVGIAFYAAFVALENQPPWGIARYSDSVRFVIG